MPDSTFALAQRLHHWALLVLSPLAIFSAVPVSTACRYWGP
jgi:hypothetical protein